MLEMGRCKMKSKWSWLWLGCPQLAGCGWGASARGGLGFPLSVCVILILPCFCAWFGSTLGVTSSFMCRYPSYDSFVACASVLIPPFPLRGIIEKGVPQAYGVRVSSTALCSVHLLRVFLCIFYIKKESDTYQNGLGYIFDTYPNPYPPCHGAPLMIILTCTLQGMLGPG